MNYWKSNKICKLFEIDIPIIQGGMIWCSGWRLASAVSNSGGLGIIGAGSMYPDILKEHIDKIKKASHKPYAVNLPLLYPDIESHIKTIIENKVPIVFTSAGNPKTWTKILKDEGIKVVHVVSSAKFAIKCEEAGVDAIVAEGFEAGGHNGREETTTFCLIPSVVDSVSLPVIAAGGIGCGRTFLAAISLGAEGIQIGSRFAACIESSAHPNFKDKIVNAKEGDTKLMLKNITPVRLLKNEFYSKVEEAENNCANQEDLLKLLGRGRAKLGMFEGNMTDGELEIGQISSRISQIESANEIIRNINNEYFEILQKIR